MQNAESITTASVQNIKDYLRLVTASEKVEYINVGTTSAEQSSMNSTELNTIVIKLDNLDTNLASFKSDSKWLFGVLVAILLGITAALITMIVSNNSRIDSLNENVSETKATIIEFRAQTEGEFELIGNRFEEIKKDALNR